MKLAMLALIALSSCAGISRRCYESNQINSDFGIAPILCKYNEELKHRKPVKPGTQEITWEQQ